MKHRYIILTLALFVPSVVAVLRGHEDGNAMAEDGEPSQRKLTQWETNQITNGEAVHENEIHGRSLYRHGKKGYGKKGHYWGKKGWYGKGGKGDYHYGKGGKGDYHYGKGEQGKGVEESPDDCYEGKGGKGGYGKKGKKGWWGKGACPPSQPTPATYEPTNYPSHDLGGGATSPPTRHPTHPPTLHPTAHPTANAVAPTPKPICSIAVFMKCQDEHGTDCNHVVATPDDCHKDVTYSYEITNNGNTEATITSVLRERGHDVSDLIDHVPDKQLRVGESTTVTETETVDFCTDKKITTIVAVEADTEETEPCDATCRYELIIEAPDTHPPTLNPTDKPTSAPTNNPTRSPTSHPTANAVAPTPKPVCSIAVFMKCQDEHGTDCNHVVATPDDCHKDVTYSYEITNNGNTKATITSVLRKRGQDVSDLIDRVPDKYLDVGESTTVTETETVDFCSDDKITTVVAVEADTEETEPCDATCRYELIIEAPDTHPPTLNPTDKPTRSPSNNPTRAPTSPPTSHPTETLVPPTPMPVCSIAVFMKCHDEYGTECNHVVATPDDCHKDVIYSYEITNNGNTEATITSVLRERGDDVSDLIDHVPDQHLDVGESTTVTETKTVDFCTAKKITTVVAVEADTEETEPCDAACRYELIIEAPDTHPPTLNPTDSPSNSPTRAPTSPPTSHPTETLVPPTPLPVCSIAVEVFCEDEDGIDCNVVACSPDEPNKDVTYYYEITNDGNTEAAITSVLRERSGDVADMVGDAPYVNLAVGESTTITETENINFCLDNVITTVVAVEADTEKTEPCDATGRYELTTEAPTPNPSTYEPSPHPSATAETPTYIPTLLPTSEPSQELGGGATSPPTEALAPTPNPSTYEPSPRPSAATEEPTYVPTGTLQPTSEPTVELGGGAPSPPTSHPIDPTPCQKCDIEVEVTCEDEHGTDCNHVVCSSDDCIRDVTYSYKITNTGNNEATITVVFRERDDDVADLVEQAPDVHLDEGESTVITETDKVNFCIDGTITTLIAVEAETDEREVCDANGRYKLTTEGAAPTPNPSTNVSPPHPSVATEDPTYVPTLMPTSEPSQELGGGATSPPTSHISPVVPTPSPICSIEVVVKCEDEHGTDCNHIVCSPKDSKKDVKYSYEITNTGHTEAAIVAIIRERGYDVSDLVGDAPDILLDAGEHTVITETETVNFCADSTITTKVVVEANDEDYEPCDGEGNYELTTEGSVPTPNPSTNVSPPHPSIMTEEPTDIPTLTPTSEPSQELGGGATSPPTSYISPVVPTPFPDCSVEVSVTCENDDGTDCNHIVCSPNDCNQYVTYSYTIKNTRNTETTVTVILRKRDSNVVDLVDSSVDLYLGEGDSVTFTEIVPVNFCFDNTFVAMIAVEAEVDETERCDAYGRYVLNIEAPNVDDDDDGYSKGKGGKGSKGHGDDDDDDDDYSKGKGGKGSKGHGDDDDDYSKGKGGKGGKGHGDDDDDDDYSKGKGGKGSKGHHDDDDDDYSKGKGGKGSKGHDDDDDYSKGSKGVFYDDDDGFSKGKGGKGHDDDDDYSKGSKGSKGHGDDDDDDYSKGGKGVFYDDDGFSKGKGGKGSKGHVDDDDDYSKGKGGKGSKGHHDDDDDDDDYSKGSKGHWYDDDDFSKGGKGYDDDDDDDNYSKGGKGHDDGCKDDDDEYGKGSGCDTPHPSYAPTYHPTYHPTSTVDDDDELVPSPVPSRTPTPLKCIGHDPITGQPTEVDLGETCPQPQHDVGSKPYQVCCIGKDGQPACSACEECAPHAEAPQQCCHTDSLYSEGWCVKAGFNTCCKGPNLGEGQGLGSNFFCVKDPEECPSFELPESRDEIPTTVPTASPSSPEDHGRSSPQSMASEIPLPEPTSSSEEAHPTEAPSAHVESSDEDYPTIHPTEEPTEHPSESHPDPTAGPTCDKNNDSPS